MALKRNLVVRFGLERGKELFIVGLFSILEALLDQPLDAILKKLPLDQPINQALLVFGGNMGKALRCSISCEQCLWDEIEFPDISMEKLCEIHLQATAWSRQSLSELG